MLKDNTNKKNIPPENGQVLALPTTTLRNDITVLLLGRKILRNEKWHKTFAKYCMSNTFLFHFISLSFYHMSYPFSHKPGILHTLTIMKIYLHIITVSYIKTKWRAGLKACDYILTQQYWLFHIPIREINAFMIYFK